MKIPTSFQLMGHTVQVRVVAKKDWKRKDCTGLFDPEHMIIFIKQAPATMQAHIFCHELMHAMAVLVEPKMYENEDTVDRMGGLLAQALTSAKY